jgi:hypothetical protein
MADGKGLQKKIDSRTLRIPEEEKIAAEWGSRPAACTNAAQPQIFNGSASWSVFWSHCKTIVEHNQWSHRKKSSQAADVLHDILRNVRNKNWTLERLTRSEV